MIQFRRIGATCLLLVALGSGLAVATLPWLGADRPGLAAVAALGAAALIAPRVAVPRGGLALVVVLLAGALIVPAVVIARAFGRVDMMAILFHADFGLKGASLAGLETEITQAVLSLMVLVLAALWLLALWGAHRSWLILLALGLGLANPLVHFALLRWVHPPVPSDLATRLHPPPDALRKGAPTDPDLVVIYLEGTDRRFADPAVWPGLYDPLTRLAREGVSLHGIRQITGTGWSLAGMVASQCGVPAVQNGLIYQNNYGVLDTFMPGLFCLGDILKDRGYALSYVVGGDTGFAGIDKFYRTHGFDALTGLQEQAALHPEDAVRAATIDWILDDQMTFATARAGFRALAAARAPFALVVETIGPHGRLGFLSRRCTADGQRGTKTADTRRVVACTLEDTAAFVGDIRGWHADLRPGRGLVIALLSDHLSHNGATPPVAAPYDGTNTAILLGGPWPPGRVIGREGSMIDLFPTILQAMRLEGAPDSANLGRSLLGRAPTLVEAEGLYRLNAMLTDDAALAARIWQPMPAGHRKGL